MSDIVQDGFYCPGISMPSAVSLQSVLNLKIKNMKHKKYEIGNIGRAGTIKGLRAFNGERVFPCIRKIPFIRCCFILGLLSFCPLFIRAQVISPSPASSSLIRDITNPVNYSTGVVGIQIPLYTLSCGDIHVPIALSYQASGIKVRDAAGWAGLGWNLSAGGKITRIVRTRPDEVGYCKSTDTLQCDGYQASLWDKWADTYDARKKGDFDGEPDMFYYEIPGRSGMFVVDYTGKAYSIPDQNIDIQWVNKKAFVITDEKGIQYLFENPDKETTRVFSYTQKASEEEYFKEQTKIVDSSDEIPEYHERDSVQDDYSYTSAWCLSRISDRRNNHIYFHYISGEDIEEKDKETRVKFTLAGRSIKEQDSTIIRTEITTKPKYLQNIRADNGMEIRFESIDDPQNTVTRRRLNEMKIYGTVNIYLKSVKFNYSYFGGQSKRLKLDEVYECSGDQSLLIGRFEYAPWYIPDINSQDFDHWGYYNGAGNKSDLVEGRFMGVRFKGANRETNFRYAQSGILTRVYSSTGGYTDYEYELNKGIYEKEGVRDSIEGGGMRVKTIRQYTGNPATPPLVTRYCYSHSKNGKTSGLVSGSFCYHYGLNWTKDEKGNSVFIGVGVCRNLSRLFDYDGAAIHYSEVTVCNPNGSRTEYHYIVESGSAQDTPSWSYNVELRNDSLPNDFAGLPNNSRFWRRGLLVTEIMYDHNNDTLSYKYNTIIWPVHGKKIIKGYIPQPLAVKSLCKYEWRSEPLFLKEVMSWKKDESSRKILYTYDENYFLPKKITIINTTVRDTFTTIYRYPFDFEAAVSSADRSQTSAYAIKWMNENHMLDYPIEVVSYKNGKVIEGEINEYKIIRPEGYFNVFVVAAKKKKLLLNFPKSDYQSCYFSKGILICDPAYHTDVFYNEYDKKGRLLSFQEEHGRPRVLVYGEWEDAPVAIIENARMDQVYYSNFENDAFSLDCFNKRGKRVKQAPCEVDVSYFVPGKYVLTYLSSTDQGQTWTWKSQPIELKEAGLGDLEEGESMSLDTASLKGGINLLFDEETTVDRDTAQISVPAGPEVASRVTPSKITVGEQAEWIDDLRILPFSARISTVNYLPGVGKIMECDHNGVSVYYEYDALGRLIRVYDNDQNILKEYEYYMAPERN